MSWFSKIKHRVKSTLDTVKKSAKQEAQDAKELAETVAKEVKQQE